MINFFQRPQVYTSGQISAINTVINVFTGRRIQDGEVLFLGRLLISAGK